MPTYGKRILDARTRALMTQQDLAQALGVSRSSIAMYEKCKREPNKEIFEKLGKVLGVSPVYLMGWVDSPDSTELNELGAKAVRSLAKVAAFEKLIPAAGFTRTCGEDANVTIYNDRIYLDQTPELVNEVIDDVTSYFSFVLERRGKPFTKSKKG